MTHMLVTDLLLLSYMPRQKAIQTSHQARQRSLLEYDTVRSSKSETGRSLRSRTKARKSRSGEDEAEDEILNSNTKVVQENKTRLKGKKKEKKEKSLKQSNSESDSPQSRKTTAHPSASSIASGSENESQALTTKGARAIRRKLEVAESDTDIEVLTSTEPKVRNEGHILSSRATKQRSLLEYTTPRKGGDQRKVARTQVRIRESGSETDSPRKIRFEPRIQSISDKHTSSPETSSDPDPGREEDDEISTRTQSQRSRRRLVQKSNSDPDSATSDGEDTSPALTRKRNKEAALSDDEENEDLPSPSKRRRLIRGNRPRSARELSSEDEQLIEEAEGEESIITSRFRKRSTKTEFVKNLERLKKKKQGKKIENDDKEDDSQESSTSNSKTKSARLRDDIFPDAKPAHLYHSEEEDTSGQDDDFIVDDDEGAVELPPMFNMGTFQDLSHHFKVACQLFVHLSIKKRGQRTEFMKQALESTYFSVPLTMSRRKLLGLRDSLVASSIWKPEFRRPLEIYPEFTLQQLDFAVPHCDACSLSSRLSTFQGQLRGQQYDHSTYQCKGKDISIDWNLGRFCAARAQVFHKLTHWEYSLFQTLDTEINSLRRKIQGRVVEGRGGIFMPATRGPPPPDEPDDADGWMEWLDGRGIIEAEWREIKNVMDRAHNLEAKGKGDDHDVEYS